MPVNPRKTKANDANTSPENGPVGVQRRF